MSTGRLCNRVEVWLHCYHPIRRSIDSKLPRNVTPNIDTIATMATSTASHLPTDSPAMAIPSGPFTFSFSLPPPSPKVDCIPKAEAPVEPATASPAPDPKRERTSLQHLPAELHTIIASHLALPSLIVHLSWTCRRLYASLGPTNRLFWYNVLYRRLSEIPPSNNTCTLLPRFIPTENYYQKCLDIMCNRTKFGCQRCLLYDEFCDEEGKGGYGVYSTRGNSSWGCGGKGGKNDEKFTHLVDIHVGGVYNGTWCWECAKEVYESTEIVRLKTPLPTIPPSLLTRMISKPCGHMKPGYFISRAAVATLLQEQCPNGFYSPFLVPHTTPSLKLSPEKAEEGAKEEVEQVGDTRQAKPYIFKTVLTLYKTAYVHIHPLFPPKELATTMKRCLNTKKFELTEGGKRAIENELIDAVFGVARVYLATASLSEEKREEERLEACRKFLLMFFGVPNKTTEKFKVAVPTTRFLAYICKRFYLSKMDDMGRSVGTPLERTLKIKYCVEDKPKRRCGICVAKHPNRIVREAYSPVLMVCHMISEHLDQISEDWPEAPELKPEEKEKITRKGRKGWFSQSKTSKGYDELLMEDVRFLFDGVDGEGEHENGGDERSSGPGTTQGGELDIDIGTLFISEGGEDENISAGDN
ncbi:hypothetical protein TWF481_011695 [Arthrobotrys musiformis]|uniref:F-box domain-containing protein n=1 Tax=Arthrobotrys musiformis TaxID=47236 RepID=A0AAV9VZA0_9PEZI